MRSVTGDTLRPGGLALTDRALDLCRFASGAALLDVGCGLGATVAHLAERGFVATGVEPSETLVERARRERPHVDVRAAVATLRSLMREVVTGGTGTALRGVPGGPVAGKTGTAEYGGGDPPRTHAWFTGFQEDLAFAVVVEDGGFGARTAAPVTADFLRRLS